MAESSAAEMGRRDPDIEEMVKAGKVEAIAAANVGARKGRWLRGVGFMTLGLTATAAALSGLWAPVMGVAVLAKVAAGLASAGIIGGAALLGGTAQGAGAAISKGLR